MNLYEINLEVKKAFERAVDRETGEIVDEEALAELDSLEMEKEQKIENILLWIKNLRADSEALKEEKQSFEKRQKAVEKRIEALKKYASYALRGETFRTTKVSASFRKSESVSYTGDVESLPESCIRRTAEINKSELKAMLKSGKKVQGASLVQTLNLQIK